MPRCNRPVLFRVFALVGMCVVLGTCVLTLWGTETGTPQSDLNFASNDQEDLSSILLRRSSRSKNSLSLDDVSDNSLAGEEFSRRSVSVVASSRTSSASDQILGSGLTNQREIFTSSASDDSVSFLGEKLTSGDDNPVGASDKDVVATGWDSRAVPPPAFQTVLPGYPEEESGTAASHQPESSSDPPAAAAAAGDQGSESSPSSLQVWVTPFHPHSPQEPPIVQPHPNAHTQPPPPRKGRGYEWVAWGRLWQAWLWPDAGFLAPSLLLREEGAHSSRVLKGVGLERCFLRGVLIGQEHASDVALSACDGGLSGVIRVGAEIFFLEPVPENDGSRQRPATDHTLLRRENGTSGAILETINSDDEGSNGEEEDYTVEEEVRRKLSRRKHMKDNEVLDRLHNVNEDDDLEDEESYLPDGEISLFGDDVETHVATPPRLHIFRRASAQRPLGPPEHHTRQKRSANSHQNYHESSDSGATLRTRTQNISSLLDEINGVVSDSEKYSDLKQESERLSGQQNSDNLHVCDATGPSAVETSQAMSDPFTAPAHHRSKRFLYSKPYTMEILVVVDAKMARYHGKHVDQYVLTLMSMVSLIYRDASLGNLIDIAVVEVLRPEGKTFASKKSSGSSAEVSGKSAEDMLKDFCKWQRQGPKQNPNEPRRFDTALLLTRENICRNPFTQNCDTLGLAELGTMCSRHSSCAIVQDNGLSAAFTIAHELGHLLNMPHDNDAKCKILKGSSNENSSPDGNVHMNVMSRMLDHNTLPWIWSNCSRHYLTEYLHDNHASCLEDRASSNQLVEDEVELTLAGELFNATKQCQYVFGKTTSICPYMPKCKRLWCTTSLDEKEGCKTQHMPWADGTPCGDGEWCLRGECVRTNKSTLQKIQGHWGHWQNWSPCSRTCGVGVSRSERYCDSPKPKFGGRYCVGERIRYKSCIMEPCPRGTVVQDFRTQQCQSYNGKNFGLPELPENVKWIPKYAGIRHEDSCKLYCQVSNSSMYYQLREKVDDGTTCGPDTYDICVNGKCRLAGCDYVLNSTAKDDWCGVCGGDNSTCQISRGQLQEAQAWGYNDVVVIPEGAARIEVTQRAFHDKADDDNYLVLVDMETGDYLLNGLWIVTPFQKVVEFAGTMLEYTGSNKAIERINSTKPLQKKLLVQILSVGKLHRPYISYSYTKSNLLTEPTYYWRLEDWSNCSQPCIGTRERSAYCVSADSGLRVGEYLCSRHPRPATLTELCALSCPVTWRYKDWSPCKIGEDGKCGRQRAVAACVTSSGNTVEHERCRTDSQPHTHSSCAADQCPMWHYHDWAPCSCVAGATEGKQQRLYSCQLLGLPIQTWKCRVLDKAHFIRNCSCWHAEPWDQWCAINGDSPRTQMEHRQLEEVYSITRYDRLRHLNLTSSDRSNQYSEPEKNTRIEAGYGEVPMLQSLDGRCGRGLRRRVVVCGNPNAPQPERFCDIATKPPEVAPCKIPCPTTTSTTTTTTTTTTTPPSYVHEEDNNQSEESYYSKRRNSFNLTNQGRRTNHNRQWQDRKKGTGGLSSNRPGPDRTEDPNELNSIRLNSHRDYSAKYTDPSHHAGYSSHGSDRNRVYSNSYNPRDNLVEEESNDLNLSVGVSNVDRSTGDSEWQVGEWDQCSRDCGGGTKRRLVVCRGRRRGGCALHLRPLDTAPCNTHACTEWTVGDWGRCRLQRGRSCGRGRRRRPVVCRDRLSSRTLPPGHCLKEDRPQNSSSCRVPCAAPRRHHHRYKWRRGPWSGCSARCGPGHQERAVTCHAISPLNWLDPDPAPGGCKPRRRPSTSRPCNMGECSRGYFWTVKPWKACQAVCGERGRQRRRVLCVDPRGNRVRAARCSRDARPRRKQRCQAPECGLTSCKQARDVLRINLDGEYALLVGGVNVSIYCLGMNVSEPREYLTLPAGEEGNYAEIYAKRLIRPETCPYNGERHLNCACLNDESGRAGLTTFSRIRLNITTLSVNMYDFTYAYAMDGRLVAYGEAGDCYSMAQCPQGAFSINLVGTPLKVSDRTKWVGYGNKASHWINRLDDSQRIIGKCGGYCGTCAPDPKVGLKLDIRIPTA